MADRSAISRDGFPESPAAGRRFLLIAEVLAYVGAVSAYAMLAAPASRAEVRWHHGAFLLLAAAFPIACNLLHGDRARSGGLRLDNLAASGRLVAPVTAVMMAAVAGTGLIVRGFHWVSWTRLLELSAGYLPWGVAQQYLLQSFALRRLRQARLPAPLAAVAAAALFGLVHAPNWPLVALTSGAGIVWCAIFLRRPNILLLGLAHGCLAVLLYHAWPVSWTQGLTIGRAYLVRVSP